MSLNDGLRSKCLGYPHESSGLRGEGTASVISVLVHNDVGSYVATQDKAGQDPSASDYLPGKKGRFADMGTIGAFLPWLQRWHGIFVINRTFTGTCAFLNGFELGSSREWTGAFTEYLRCETAAPEAGGWPELVLSATLGPDVTLAQAPGFTPEQDTAVCEGLFARLNRFLDE